MTAPPSSRHHDPIAGDKWQSGRQRQGGDVEASSISRDVEEAAAERRRYSRCCAARRPASAAFLHEKISGVRAFGRPRLRAPSIRAVPIFGIPAKVRKPCVGAKKGVADHRTGGKKIR